MHMTPQVDRCGVPIVTCKLQGEENGWLQIVKGCLCIASASSNFITPRTVA
jgi:hypothetical protein